MQAFEKIEEFLFDFLGLIIPGVLLGILMFLFPLISSDFTKIIKDFQLENRFFFEMLIKVKTANYRLISNKEFIIVFCFISYILGHSIKVLSKYKYNIGKWFFDDGLLLLISKIFSKVLELKLPKFISIWVIRCKLLNWFIIKTPLKKLFLEVFTFKADSYDRGNSSIKTEVLEMLNRNYKVNFPKEWYSIYQISRIITMQENLKNLSQKFLAKYTFYKSLSLIFLFNQMYMAIYHYYFKNYFTKIGHSIYGCLLVVNIILWFTFHSKYKRYWTLCGNELLMSLF